SDSDGQTVTSSRTLRVADAPVTFLEVADPLTGANGKQLYTRTLVRLACPDLGLITGVTIYWGDGHSSAGQLTDLGGLVCGAPANYTSPAPGDSTTAIVAHTPTNHYAVFPTAEIAEDEMTVQGLDLLALSDVNTGEVRIAKIIDPANTDMTAEGAA